MKTRTHPLGWLCRFGSALLGMPLLGWAQEAAPLKRSMWTLPPLVSPLKTVDDLFWLIFIVTTVIFFMVQTTLVVFLIKYRGKEGRRATYIHGNNRLEIIWTAIPALFLAFLAFVSQQAWSKIKPSSAFTQEVHDSAVPIEIVAQQFAWNIRYPGRDGIYGRRRPELVSASNPIGLDPEDPASTDDILTINQLHFPVNHEVRIRLSSRDVLHSFFLPEFRVKQDAVPGMQINVLVEGTVPGNYEIACAELCGLGHYRMKGFVTVHPNEPAFQKWLDEKHAELLGEPEPDTPASPGEALERIERAIPPQTEVAPDNTEH